MPKITPKTSFLRREKELPKSIRQIRMKRQKTDSDIRKENRLTKRFTFLLFFSLRKKSSSIYYLILLRIDSLSSSGRGMLVPQSFKIFVPSLLRQNFI